MKSTSRPRRSRRRLPVAGRARRGIALFVAMFFVAGVGALALSAIYLTANATLLGKSYEKEDDLKYVSEAALAIGKAELNFNPAALPNTSYVALMLNKTLTSADGQPLTGTTVNLYVGPSGSTSGQFGRFASVVAEARDANGTGFVRRLELTQESFAKYAYWTNSEGSNISFGGGDQLWGPVWSNDDIDIASSGATFHDAVGTAGSVTGASNGTFSKGYQTHQRAITLPSLSSLSSLSGLATVGGMNFTAPSSGDESTVRMRIEFVAADMDGIPGNTDSTGVAEGFYRIYTASSGNEEWLRGDWLGPTITSVINCGDWHQDSLGVSRFFPASVHNTQWFQYYVADSMKHGGHNLNANVTAAATEKGQSLTNIMKHAGARCYLGGDPHLAAITRVGQGYLVSRTQIGGEDTTFTPTDSRGKWTLYSNTPNTTIATNRPKDAKYLFPLYRGFNTSTKGVMYVSGTVGVSGVLRGDLTLYSPKTVVILDDLRYANDPAKGVCVDILGIISGANTMVADNALNSPVSPSGGTTASSYRSLDDTPDMYIHAVIMALGNSFGVEDYDSGPTNATPCQSTSWGRGCLYITGGLIQNTRGAVGQTTGSGFLKRYSYDRCAVINPPPYFPTTGRFQDNRYYELDPVRFNVGQLFQSITPG